MAKVLTLPCPECGLTTEVQFPPSFFFGRAVLECEFCNLKIEGTGDSNYQAAEDLLEQVKDLENAKAVVQRYK